MGNNHLFRLIALSITHFSELFKTRFTHFSVIRDDFTLTIYQTKKIIILIVKLLFAESQVIVKFRAVASKRRRFAEIVHRVIKIMFTVSAGHPLSPPQGTYRADKYRFRRLPPTCGGNRNGSPRLLPCVSHNRRSSPQPRIHNRLQCVYSGL